MVPFLLAAAMAVATPCPADLLVANPRLKIVRASDKTRDNFIVTIEVKNRGVAAQPMGTQQHLELVRGGRVIGTQAIPGLGPDEDYLAAFRVQFPHEGKRAPFAVEFRYVLDSKNSSRANCTSVNDRLTATL